MTMPKRFPTRRLVVATHVTVILLVTVLATSSPSQAWHATGHLITAQIAYDELGDSARREVDRLIAVLADEPPGRDHAVTAALWADDLKQQGVTIFSHWHYINLAIKAEGLKEAPEPREENVVWAIEQTVSVLRSDASDLSKALMLRFLLHFVGDIHQPMHCATEFTTARPDGDRGGNEFVIDHRLNNLHAFWDDGAGLLPVLDESDWRPLIRRLADELKQSVAKRSLPGWRENRPSEWAQESLEIAVDSAYSGILEGSKPTPEYVSRARSIVRRQMALGGYRLGALLNDIFSGVEPTLSEPAEQ